MANSYLIIQEEKKAAIEAFIDAIVPIAFNMMDCTNENAKNTLDKLFKRIKKVLENVVKVNDYSNFQLLQEKKAAIIACTDTIKPIIITGCTNESDKNALDEALKGIVKILDHDFQIVQEKKAAIIACMDALAPVNMMDCTNEDAKNALDEALKSIATYPNIDSLKRRVLKPYTPDHYAVVAQTHLLGIRLNRECYRVPIELINKALGNVLELLQGH